MSMRRSQRLRTDAFLLHPPLAGTPCKRLRTEESCYDPFDYFYAHDVGQTDRPVETMGEGGGVFF